MSLLPHIVVGGGGHARVLIDVLRRMGRDVIGVTDADPERGGHLVADVQVLGTDEILLAYDGSAVRLVNGIGSTGDMTLRRLVYERLRRRGFEFAFVVDPRAHCASDVDLGDGAQVMCGAVIQTGTRIGTNTIVNTLAAVDHDCTIGAHCHVACGAVLAGSVTVGEATHIGAGATVIQGIEIGAGVLVGAGSVVVDNVHPGERVAGVPAREIGRRADATYREIAGAQGR